MTVDTGIGRLLRPYWNFEFDYDTSNGVGDGRPILFTYPMADTPPVNNDLSVLDIEASQVKPAEGISPVLAKMVPVPFASTILLEIPVVPAFDPDISYVWRLISRNRSLAQGLRNSRVFPYSLPQSSLATVDTRTQSIPFRPATTLAGNRYLLMGTQQCCRLQRVAPFDNETPMLADLWPDAVRIPASSSLSYYGFVRKTALYPGIAAAKTADPGGDYVEGLDYGQGVFDPRAFEVLFGGELEGFASTGALFEVFSTKAYGDEVAVECFKYKYDREAQNWVPAPWRFLNEGVISSTAEDFVFSVFFGVGADFYSLIRPKMGVLMSSGQASE